MISKRIIGLLSGILAILVLIMIVWIILYSLERARINEVRQNIFCEQITPGMSLSDVRSVLSQYGTFRETESSFSSGLVAVGIYFTDPVANRQLGRSSIVLIFNNGQYTDARVPVPLRDSYRSLCH